MYDLFYCGRSNYVWEVYKNQYPHIKRVTSTNPYKSSAQQSFTSMCWMLHDHIDFFPGCNFSKLLPTYEKCYVHIWPIMYPDSHKSIPLYETSVQLWPRSLARSYDQKTLDISSMQGQLKIHDNAVGRYISNYDIFFVSYSEPNADQNWNKLKERFPFAKRVHGVQGIANAHRQCAELSTTDMFWTVDGDTVVNNDWNFQYYVSPFDRNYVHIWYSQNPVNNLKYGYGAVKLWPTNRVLEFNGAWLDYTTSIGEIKIISDTIAITAFNSNEFETWKSAFRETIKLLKNIQLDQYDKDSRYRLEQWRTVFLPVDFAIWAKKGTEDACNFFNKHENLLDYINDFNWLQMYFKHLYA